jgi:uncharacterized membrane protein YedE/YeeE
MHRRRLPAVPTRSSNFAGLAAARALNEVTAASLTPTVAWGAFILAFIFGAAAQRSNFCTMGALSDGFNMGDWTRMRMWLMAMAVAILGANALHLAGLIDLSKSLYQTPNFTWLSYIVGGLAFGFGMPLASGCGSKTLIRIGGGNLKSLVVALALGVSAYMTLKGLFAVGRVNFLDPVAVTLAGTQDLPSLAARAAGGAQRTWQIALSLIVAFGLIGFAFKSRDFRNADTVIMSSIIGLTVVGGWYVSGHIGHLAEDPSTLQEAFAGTNSGRMESFSFVAPIAYTLELLMFWSDKSRVVTFGVAAALGMVAGSFVYSIATRSFRWEGFRDAEDTANHLVGGVLMGFGGVTALGCTIGQGISGISTLALGSFITVAAIIVGSVGAFKYQYWRAG